MGKKILVIVGLFVLFMFIDVKAITCEYSSGGINIKLESDNLGWAVRSTGYTAYGNSIKSPTNQCPSTIYYKCSGSTCYVADNSSPSSFPSYATGRSGSISKSSQGSGSSGGSNSWQDVIGSDPDCETIYGEILEFLQDNVFKPIYFLTPIVLIILTTVDFAKAVFSDEKDSGMKKAQGSFVKRAIAALLVLLSPTFVSIILKLLSDLFANGC